MAISSHLATGGCLIMDNRSWGLIVAACSLGGFTVGRALTPTRIETAPAPAAEARPKGPDPVPEAARLRAEAENFKDAGEKAQAAAEKLRAEADRIRREAVAIEAREREEMQGIYPDLKKLGEEENRIDEHSTFRLTGSPILNSGQRVAIKHVNDTTDPLQPRFGLYFLDRYGFVLGSVSVYWAIESIAPGEARVEDLKLDMLPGHPVYYLARKR